MRACGRPTFWSASRSANYNRIFASMYPGEVAGLVLLDPSQEDFIEWLQKHHPDRAISKSDVANWPEGACIWASLDQLNTVGPLPDVLTIVVTGARPRNEPLQRELLPIWTKSHEDWVHTRPQGRHVLATSSGHSVQIEAPELTIDLIREVVGKARAEASVHPLPQLRPTGNRTYHAVPPLKQ